MQQCMTPPLASYGCSHRNWSTTVFLGYSLGDRPPSFVGSVDIYLRGGSPLNSDRTLLVLELLFFLSSLFARATAPIPFLTINIFDYKIFTMIRNM